MRKRLLLIHNTESKRGDIDKFAHICKLIPTDKEDMAIDEIAFTPMQHIMLIDYQ